MTQARILTKIFCIFFLFTSTNHALNAQLLPINSVYRFNWQMGNPAAIDKTFILSNGRYRTMGNINHRQQWLNVEDAPVTSFASFEQYAESNSVRWGGMVMRDRAGAVQNDGAFGNFSYFKQFTRSRYHIIHFGLNAGIISARIKNDELRFADDLSTDPASAPTSKIFFDVGAGALYRFDRYFYIGLSLPQMLAVNVINKSESGAILGERWRNFPVYLLAGGYIELANGGAVRSDTWSLEPSLWLRYLPTYQYYTILDNLPLSADFDIQLNVPLTFEGALWINAGIGTNQTARLGVGYDSEFPFIRSSGNTKSGSNRMDIGFTYEFPFGKMIYPLGQTLALSIKFAMEK
ncbi:MAG: type IX secretion system PorP/SprF family membrane protein [Saprospiraceae bacterium]|jgi:type IX secretion system PorP/SprF family membrane protein